MQNTPLSLNVTLSVIFCRGDFVEDARIWGRDSCGGSSAAGCELPPLTLEEIGKEGENILSSWLLAGLLAQKPAAAFWSPHLAANTTTPWGIAATLALPYSQHSHMFTQRQHNCKFLCN